MKNPLETWEPDFSGQKKNGKISPQKITPDMTISRLLIPVLIIDANRRPVQSDMLW
jgi:hypothetical protein